MWEQNTINPVNYMDIEGAIESIRINEVSVLSIGRLDLEEMKGLSFPMDNANCLK